MDLIVVNYDFMICMGCKNRIEEDRTILRVPWKFCPFCGKEWREIVRKDTDQHNKFYDDPRMRTERLYPLKFEIWEWSMGKGEHTSPYDWEREGSCRDPKDAIEWKNRLEVRNAEGWYTDCWLIEIIATPVT